MGQTELLCILEVLLRRRPIQIGDRKDKAARRQEGKDQADRGSREKPLDQRRLTRTDTTVRLFLKGYDGDRVDNVSSVDCLQRFSSGCPSNPPATTPPLPGSQWIDPTNAPGKPRRLANGREGPTRLAAGTRLSQTSSWH